MAEVWRSDERLRTPTGALVHAAKDHSDAPAGAVLAQRFGSWFAGLPGVSDDAVVVAVPPDPRRGASLVPLLAEAAARHRGLELALSTLVRAESTARLRDTPPAERRSLAEAAGYRVVEPLSKPVVLIDDVVLTGTTLDHVGACLRAAGVASLTIAVAARSRRAGSTSG